MWNAEDCWSLPSRLHRVWLTWTRTLPSHDDDDGGGCRTKTFFYCHVKGKGTWPLSQLCNMGIKCYECMIRSTQILDPEIYSFICITSIAYMDMCILRCKSAPCEEKLLFRCWRLKGSQLSSTCCAIRCACSVSPSTSAAVAAWAPADTSDHALLVQHALRDCNDCGD